MNAITNISLGKELASVTYPYPISLVEYDDGKLANLCHGQSQVFIISPDGMFLNNLKLNANDEETYLYGMSQVGVEFKEVDGQIIYETESGDYRLTVSADRLNLRYDIGERSIIVDLAERTITVNGHEVSTVYRMDEDITEKEYLLKLFHWTQDLGK